MSLQTLTFEAPKESIATIDEIAANREVDRAEILRDALAMYLAEHEDLRTDIEEAERQLDAGDFLTHEEVVARHRARIQISGAA